MPVRAWRLVSVTALAAVVGASCGRRQMPGAVDGGAAGVTSGGNPKIVGATAGVTVKSAAVLVMEPFALVTTQRNWSPLIVGVTSKMLNADVPVPA